MIEGRISRHLELQKITRIVCGEELRGCSGSLFRKFCKTKSHTIKEMICFQGTAAWELEVSSVFLSGETALVLNYHFLKKLPLFWISVPMSSSAPCILCSLPSRSVHHWLYFLEISSTFPSVLLLLVTYPSSIYHLPTKCHLLRCSLNPAYGLDQMVKMIPFNQPNRRQ